MLKKQIEEYILKASNKQTVELFTEEKEYTEKHQLTKNITIIKKENKDRFTDAYIERSNKETEEMISEESARFLSQPLEYLKINKNEFLYIESAWFDLIGVETLSLEVDDVFGTYNALFGLKFPKKRGQELKAYLNQQLKEEIGAYSAMFNDGDGVWDINFALNGADGFEENISLNDALTFLYRFLFTLVETLEESK